MEFNRLESFRLTHKKATVEIEFVIITLCTRCKVANLISRDFGGILNERDPNSSCKEKFGAGLTSIFPWFGSLFEALLQSLEDKAFGSLQFPYIKNKHLRNCADSPGQECI